MHPATCRAGAIAPPGPDALAAQHPAARAVLSNTMELPHPIKALAVCVLACAVAVGAPAAASAAAKPTPRLSDCQKLAKRKDLAKDRKLVVVVRGNDEAGRISACVLPRGKIRTLSSWDDGLSRDWANIVGAAGLYVLVEDGHGDQYGGASRALTRVHVRSGKRLALSGWGCQLGFGGPPHCDAGSDYGEVAMAATGRGRIRGHELRDRP